MSRSSSSDLETTITQQALQKQVKKTKKKAKPSPDAVPDPTTTENGKNEGDDPHWAYEPPGNATLLDHTVNACAFEWDALKDDDDTEIWLIRVPDTIKAKHLEGLEIDPPSASSSRTARIGGLTRKTGSYDVWFVREDETDVALAGAEELHGLSCLLPRQRKGGKLYVAPKRISHHIVVSARPSIATAPEQQPVVHQNPPRTSYPKHMLKHAFVPYGARSAQVQSEDASMDVGGVEHPREKPTSTAATPFKDKAPKSEDSRGGKRKVETETPRRSKRHKTDT